MLTPVETFWLNWHAAHSPAPDDLRARILLLSNAGARPEAVAESLGLPLVEVTTTLERFAAHRLTDFPRPALSPDALSSAAGVDAPHARRVADSALALFKGARNLHRLPASLRPALEMAALLHDVGLAVDRPKRHTTGRELLRGVDLAGFTRPQQQLIADVVGLHRKKVKPDEEGYLAALSPARRRQTLALAALLRVADGLDASQTQTTQLHGVVTTPEAVTLRLSGPKAKGDAARARKRADLWRVVFHLPLETAPAPEPPPDLQQLAATPLTPETSMVEVTRRALAAHLLRWQANEAAALEGEAQAVKAVRVSARRWRQALKLFGGYFKRKPARYLRQLIRKAEDVLGALRDWEALLADVKAHRVEAKNGTSAGELQALTTAWEKERRSALQDVKKWLGGPEAADLHTALMGFISAPPVRADESVREAAPKVLRAALAEVAEAQAAIDADRPRSYHELRLAFKQIRYTLEFLGPALAPEAQALVADLVKMQDRLGALNDTRLLQRRLADYLDTWAEHQARRKAPQLHGAQGLLEYSHARRESWSQQVQDLTTDWPPVRAARLKQRVNALLRALKSTTRPARS